MLTSTASDVAASAADDEEEGNMFAVLFYAASHTFSSSLTSKCILL